MLWRLLDGNVRTSNISGSKHRRLAKCKRTVTAGLAERILWKVVLPYVQAEKFEAKGGGHDAKVAQAILFKGRIVNHPDHN